MRSPKRSHGRRRRHIPFSSSSDMELNSPLRNNITTDKPPETTDEMDIASSSSSSAAQAAKRTHRLYREGQEEWENKRENSLIGAIEISSPSPATADQKVSYEGKGGNLCPHSFACESGRRFLLLSGSSRCV